MPVNHFFQSGVPQGRRSEQFLIEDLITECIKIYGHDIMYLPRSVVNFDNIFTEDPLNTYSHSYAAEVYMENNTGFQGDGDLLSKFGVELRDSATFIISRRRWIELIGRTGNSVLTQRPAEGDIIYFPLTESLFEIKRVENANPFYQVGKLYVYKMECELMQQSSEVFATGVEEIDILGNTKSLDVTEFEFLLETDDVMLLETESRSALIAEGFNIDTIDNQSQNDIFEETVDTVLDFSERNPFGDIV